MTAIDTHHHFVPDFYVQAVEAAGGDPSGWPTPAWTPSSSVASLDRNGATRAILSLTAPGAVIAPTDTERRALARRANEYAASLRDSDPSRWGFFAALPCLLDAEGTLAEIRYALDELHADGVTLFTRYGPRNQYLGDETFRPIWADLSSRRAVVFIHPTHPADTTPVNTNPFVPQPAVDYPHETTRTAVDLILTNRKRENPGCKIILSHAGGTLPFLISRLCTVSSEARPTARVYGKSPEEIMADFRSFYFDLALSSSPSVLRLVLELVPPSQILYGMPSRRMGSIQDAWTMLTTFKGSDFPYASPQKTLGFKELLDEFHMDKELRGMIYFKNAESILPGEGKRGKTSL